jgi:DNA-binding transcriptional ArsR family regulator
MLLAADIAGALVEALSFAVAMFWEILWALILGFFLSAVVQAVVSKGEMRRLLPDGSPRSIAIACGYIALATATIDNAVSYALRHLRAAGLVQRRRQGRVIYYRLADARLHELTSQGREIAGG